MKETDELPDEIKCFICLKIVDKLWQKQFATLITTSDGTLLAMFAVCPDDCWEWIVKNRDAATALVQSRIEAALKRDKNSDTGL